jgi:hypothetical protein
MKFNLPRLQIIFSVAVSLLSSTFLNGQTPISIDLNQLTDGAETSVISSNGATITFTALNDWNGNDDGKTKNSLIRTNIGLQFDTNLQQNFQFTISSDKTINLTHYATSFQSGLPATVELRNAAGTLLGSIHADSTFNFNTQTYAFGTPFTILANEVITATYVNMGGFTLQSLSGTLIPESSTYALILCLGALGIAAYRRQKGP